MLLLKPLSKALECGDRIHGVIKGSAINHGGQAGGLTVPNPQKQSVLLTAAWQKAGIKPEDLSYIEAHGTGTALGDPIEIEGIAKAYGHLEDGGDELCCGIGSVKSNLGHLEAAAGITGLLKVILCLKQRQLPGAVHLESINPKIQLAASPLYIVEKSLSSAGATALFSGGE